MKLPTKPINKLITLVLALSAFLGVATRGNSQSTTVTVDTSQTWLGYINVFTLDYGYEYGFVSGTGALQADFLGTTQLDLSPCTNSAYVNSAGTPADLVEASFYVQSTSLVNTNVTFTGICLSNTLTANPEPNTGIPYTCTAFIETFNSSFGEITSVSSNMVAGRPFSITLATTNVGTVYVQYGFLTFGPDVNPAEYPTLGNVVIAATNIVQHLPTPTSTAATPTNAASGVLAMYDSSGIYGTVSGIDWYDPNSSDSVGGVTDYTISNTTDVVLEYTNLQYAVVDGFNINASAYNEIHMDVWTPNANQLGIQLVSLDGGNPQAPQVNLGSSTIVPGQWNSVNIPLSEFEATNSTLDLTALQQLLFVDNMAGGFTGGTFYIDNVYFYSNSALAPPQPPLPQPTTAAPVPPANLNNVVAMWNSSGTYSDTEVEDEDAQWSDPAYGVTYFTITNTSNPVLEYASLQFAGWEFYNTGDEEINVSADNTMHIDVWTPNANQFGIELVSLDDSVTQGHQVNVTPASGTIVSNQWVGLDIPLCEFTSAPNVANDFNGVDNTLDLTDLQQMLFLDNQPGGGLMGGTFYVDNVYFYESSVAQSQPLTINVTSGTVNLSFPTENGFTYTVQYTTSLTNPSWQTLSTGSNIAGNNYAQTATDTLGTTTRFYRVIATQ